MPSIDERSRQELKYACIRLQHALHDRDADLESAYDSVAALARTRTEGPPVVFWRKWGRTAGKIAIPTLPNVSDRKFAEYAIVETNNVPVVLVEGPPTYKIDDITDYLISGARAAYMAGAASVGVITARRHFTDEVLRAFHESPIQWLLVSDRVEDQKHRFTALCPGLFDSFPYLRDRKRTDESFRHAVRRPMTCQA